MPVPSAVISVPISARGQHLVEARLSTFRILPRSGRIAWNRPVAALLGRAAGGVALDDEHFGKRRIALLDSRRACRGASRRRARPYAG